MKPKLGILINSFSEGGVERVTLNLLETLRKHFRCYLIILESGMSMKLHPDIEVITLSQVSQDLSRWGRGLNSVKAIPAYMNYLSRNGIGVVMSLMERSNIINAFSKLLSGRRAVLSIHIHLSNNYMRYPRIQRLLMILLMKSLYKKSDAIVSISSEIKKDLIDNIGVPTEKIKVINNPFKIEEIATLSGEAIEREHEEIYRNPVVITSGRLAMQKGHWYLIRAFKVVAEEIPEAKLVILGHGNLREYLGDLVEGLALTKSVVFLGWQDNAYKFISKADVFAFPSLFEGFPMALVEAMVCRCPVVSTDCRSGPREILEGGECGILVPPFQGELMSADDPIMEEEEILAQAILKLLRERALRDRLVDRAFHRVKQYDISVIGERYVNLLSNFTRNYEKN